MVVYVTDITKLAAICRNTAYLWCFQGSDLQGQYIQPNPGVILLSVVIPFPLVHRHWDSRALIACDNSKLYECKTIHTTKQNQTKQISDRLLSDMLCITEKTRTSKKYMSGYKGCLVTWFPYQPRAKPGNKTVAPPWPEPCIISIWFGWFVSSDILKIMPSDVCHWTLLMISHHWSR